MEGLEPQGCGTHLRILVNTISGQKKYRRAIWIIVLCSLVYVNLLLFLFGEQQLQIEPVTSGSPVNSLTTDPAIRPVLK